MELYPFLETNYNGLLKSLREKKAFDDAIKAEAKKALDQFKEQFRATIKDEEQAKENEEASKNDQASAPAEKMQAKDSATDGLKEKSGAPPPPPQPVPEKVNAPAK